MLRQISQKRFYLCKDVFGSTVIMFWGIDSVEGNAYPLNLVFLYGKGNLLLQSGRCWRTWWLPPSCFSTASHLLLVSHVFTWWWASLKTGHWETSASGFFFLWETPTFRHTCSVFMYVKNGPEQAPFLQGWGHTFRIYMGRRVFVSPRGLGIALLSSVSSLHFYLWLPDLLLPYFRWFQTV